MITNFEEITADLTQEELQILHHVMRGFYSYRKENPMKSKDIVIRLNQFLQGNGIKIKMTGVRLRKFVNHIRVNSLLPLIATSKGYYVSQDREEIEKQIKSLRERAASIAMCADGLEKIINPTESTNKTE